MKKAILTGIFALLITIINAQQPLSSRDSAQFLKIVDEVRFRDTIKTRYEYDAKTGIWTTKTRDISINTFDSLFKPIYSKVMLGDANLINQGSAYALTVNQFESKFNLNYSWARDKKNIGGSYFNMGFAASSSSKSVPIFSKDQWQQGFSLSFGITKPVFKSIFYDREDDYDLKRRKALILTLRETLNVLRTDTAKFARNRDLLDATSWNIWYDPTHLIDTILRTEYNTRKDYEKAETELKNANNLRHLDANGITQYVDSCFAAFETSYFKEYYYSLWWFNATLRPEYKGLTIYDTTAVRIFDITKRHFFRLGVDLNLNYARSRKHSLLLMQVGVGFKNTNYLEGKKPGDLDFIYSSLAPDIQLKQFSEAIILSEYEKYKKNFLLISPLIGFNWFFGKKRTIGWEAFFSSKIGTQKNDIPFDNLFTFRTGPLISLNGKSDLAKSTFGIIAQWEDVKYNGGNISDNFSLSVRIGIPFNF